MDSVVDVIGKLSKRNLLICFKKLSYEERMCSPLLDILKDISVSKQCFGMSSMPLRLNDTQLDRWNPPNPPRPFSEFKICNNAETLTSHAVTARHALSVYQNKQSCHHNMVFLKRFNTRDELKIWNGQLMTRNRLTSFEVITLGQSTLLGISNWVGVHACAPRFLSASRRIHVFPHAVLDVAGRPIV